MNNFFGVSDDVSQNILSRLPAKSFAFAACVNRYWNRICSQILSHPRLVSALSLNPSAHLAIEEVLQKVLFEPIRPHFAIAFVGFQFCLQTTHLLIAETLGSNVPLITTAAAGIIGIDAITDQVKEVKWDLGYNDGINREGIVLLVGFVPGLKIGTLPLIHSKSEPHAAMVDNFVSDVTNYTISVSGDANPVCIMLFGDHRTDLKPVIAEIDQKMPRETTIVGDACSYFICTSGEETQHFDPNAYSLGAVGLVFAKDKQTHKGDVKFHVTISTGIVPFGPKLEVASVWENEEKFSWLTVRVEDEAQVLDASEIIQTIGSTIEDEFHNLYIGVVREKPLGSGRQTLKYLAFHEVVGNNYLFDAFGIVGGHFPLSMGADQEMFIVSGIGIKSKDLLFFYHSDSGTAMSSSDDVYNSLSSLKLSSSPVHHHRRLCRRISSSSSSSSSSREQVFGGMIFASSGRGEKFFGESNMNCMPFSRNFPGISFGGMFCYAPIGRGAILEEENDDAPCIMKAFSTVYLAMSYSPIAP